MNIERSTCNNVIPLSSRKGKDTIKYTFQPYENSATLCQVRIKQCFPYNLAFAMTVHEALNREEPFKGLSLISENILTKLSSVPYTAIFVALSRVKESSHLCLLEHTPMLTPGQPFTLGSHIFHQSRYFTFPSRHYLPSSPRFCQGCLQNYCLMRWG